MVTASIADNSLAQKMARARERLNARALDAQVITPEQMSHCNALLDLVRESLINQIDKNPVGELQLRYEREFSTTQDVAVPAIMAFCTSSPASDDKANAESLGNQLLSDSLSVGDFMARAP